MSIQNETKADRYHAESRESVDAVLERMCRAIGRDPALGGYAKALDISDATIRTWRRRGEVTVKFIRTFAAEHGLDERQLMYGDQPPTPVLAFAAEPRPPAGSAAGDALLTWREVLVIAVDELRAQGVSLPGEKLADVVDLLMEFQELGMHVDRESVAKQLRLVAA